MYMYISQRDNAGGEIRTLEATKALAPQASRIDRYRTPANFFQKFDQKQRTALQTFFTKKFDQKTTPKKLFWKSSGF